MYTYMCVYIIHICVHIYTYKYTNVYEITFECPNSPTEMSQIFTYNISVNYET